MTTNIQSDDLDIRAGSVIFFSLVIEICLMMKTLGLILGILAALGMLLGFIPLLGWLNWVNIPFAMIGFIVSVLGKSRPGTILTAGAIVFGILRLMLGGGIL